MRKLIALKTMLRTPVKTLLTCLLIAAATFALFSKVTDYAVTTREAAKAESFYHGAAGLDNSTPFMGTPKPWPTDAQIAEFSSLPGVTLADTRYTTDGLVEDYKRVIDQSSYVQGEFVLEGTYDGLEDYDSGSLYLIFHDITVLAGELQFNPDRPLKIKAQGGDFVGNSYSRTFFDELKKGSRFLVLGSYLERSGTAFELGSYMEKEIDYLRVIDGLGKDYLQTEEFSRYRGIIEARNQSNMAYDIVYTSDMRAIPYVNTHKLAISKGRPLTTEDTDVCVVSELFLDTYDLSVGDKLHIELGDKLLQGQGKCGTRYRTAENLTNFVTSVDLEIIGAYHFNDEWIDRLNDSDWSYGPATIFVPASLLPVEVPKDHEIRMGDFSVFIEDPHNIEEFRAAAELMAAEMGIALRYSDGGWSGIKDNLDTGSLASLLTTVLYILGAVLALLLAVYLYIERNKKSFAIMRTLGVPGKKAGISVTLPFVVLSIFAIPVGSITGLFYASHTASKTLANISGDSAPEGYVYILNAAIPTGIVVLCLVLELLFIFFVTLLFLWRMKKISPLELLQDHTDTSKKAPMLQNRFTGVKHKPDITDAGLVPYRLDITKLSDELISTDLETNKFTNGTYRAPRQVCAYILRHMQRGIGKTVGSLLLTVVLAAGIGMFVLARLSYQEAYQELDVKGRAMKYSSNYITELSKSDFIKDIYYYNNYRVRVNGVGILSPMTFTNNFDQYLTDDYTVTYAKGYDRSVFEGTGAVCLIGQTLAETLGVQPGDDITLMSEDLYSFMPQVYEEDELEFAIERAGKSYKVVGILHSEDADENTGIYSVINEAAENLYSQPFPVDYCEFTVADNEKIMELEKLLEELKEKGMRYSLTASFHIDSDLFKTTTRVRNLLDSLFPIAMTAAVLVGLLGPGLVIMQSAQEAGFLRILGVTKKRARCILIFEQILLCISGIILVAAILALCSPGLVVRSTKTLAFCWSLYFLGSVLGTLLAAVQVTRHRILELLQVRE